MSTEAYFSNIQNVILENISRARSKICIAVPWFTDKVLFNSLIEASERGVVVEVIILDDEVNKDGGIAFNELMAYNCQNKVVYANNLGNKKIKPLLHSKYCIIDDQTIISGSYNWTYKAQHNDESIIVSKNKKVVGLFIRDFERVIEKKSTADSKQEEDDQTTWLLINNLRNAILADNDCEIRHLLRFTNSHLHKVNSLFKEQVVEIIKKCEASEYLQAIYFIGEINKSILKKAMGLYLEAESLIEKGEKIYAVELLENSINVKPDFDKAMVLYSDLLTRFKMFEECPKGNYEEAALIFSDISSSINVTSLDAYLNCHRIKNSILECFTPISDDKLHEMLLFDPKNPEILLFIGKRLVSKMEYEQAEEFLQRAIEMDPQSVKPYPVLAKVYAETDQEDLALEFLSKYITIVDNDINALIEYGVLLVNNGSIDDGIKQLAKAQDLDPNNKEPSLLLDEIRKTLGL